MDIARTARGSAGIHLALQVVLRMAIGWHFLYEGLSKALGGAWTARDYLAAAEGPLAPAFQWIAENPGVLATVDFLNVWGQVLIGLGLLLGLFSRTASLAGALLLALYYIARPQATVVNATLVEMLALVTLAAFPTGKVVGLDRLLSRRRLAAVPPGLRTPAATAAGAGPPQAIELPPEGRPPGAPLTDRRELLRGLAGVPFAVAVGSVAAARRVWLSAEEQALVDAFSGASRKPFAFQTLKDLKETVPKAKLGGKDVSRIILGGNIICGFAHSRDLIYVSSLVRAYHTPEKIFESLALAEKCGINTILTHPSIAPAINLYWKQYGGKIQFLADCGWLEGTDTLGAIDYAVDHGATLCYLQGEAADAMVREGRWDYLNACLERVRKNGLPMGIGAHRIATLRAIAEKGITPDFWMKTFHPMNYWSARHPEEYDNKYCYNPAETIAFMRERPEPWIAFKTMAAGAVRPAEAFRYAFESGADFICAGMYDFQMVEDANIAVAILGDPTLKRERPWVAPAAGAV